VQRTFHQQGASADSGIRPVAYSENAFAAGSRVERYPDEYLLDGGDRDKPVHYDTYRRLGLDTEDAVVEYSDDGGNRRVKPTNRVAVYAPRFAAVRTYGQSSAGVAAQRPAGVDDSRPLAGLRLRTGTLNHKQRRVPDSVRMRSRGSGIDSTRREVTGKHLQSPASHRLSNKPVEHLNFVKTGQLQRTEEAILAASIQAAAVWSKKRYPVAVASTQQSGEVSARAHFEEYVGTDDSHKKPGALRVVKLADKQDAQQGDVITFTIRYDNLGERPLRNIRIVDNLTPRLQYVDDSADSDRAGRLVIEDNLEGSLVLKFELPGDLPGGKGGVVTFQARVK